MKVICIIDTIITPLAARVRQEDKKYRLEQEKFPTEFDSMKEFFLGFQQLYGRCISRMYQDRGNETVHIGWVFEKKEEYERQHCDEGRQQFFIQETWVSLFDSCQDCDGRGHILHEIVYPPHPPPEQECSASENPL